MTAAPSSSSSSSSARPRNGRPERDFCGHSSTGHTATGRTLSGCLPAGSGRRNNETPPPGQRSRQRGVALIAVLWIVTSLTILILSFNASVRSHLDVASSELGLARTGAIIDGALRLAVLRIRTDDLSRRWRADGRPYQINVVGRTVEIRVHDEKAFVDLNKAPSKLIAAVVARQLGPGNGTGNGTGSGLGGRSRRAKAIVAAIDRRRGANRGPGRQSPPRAREPDLSGNNVRLNGAPQRPPAAAANANNAGQKANQAAAFIDAIQLRDLPGIKPTEAAALAPFVTTYNGSPTINALTAPKALLASLPGINKATVNSVIALRDSAKPDIEAVTRRLARWQPFVSTTAGPAYRVRIEVTDRAAVPAAAEIVIWLGKSTRPYHVLGWREARPQPR